MSMMAKDVWATIWTDGKPTTPKIESASMTPYSSIWPDTIPVSSSVLADNIFACWWLTPSWNEQRRQVIDQAIQNYKAKNPEKYDAYMNQRQDYINSRNNWCDFDITHLKPYGANALSQTVLDSLNSIFSAQPYWHYANSFEVSSVVVDNIEDMFPNAFNPSTNELHYFDAIEDMIDYFFDNNLQSTHLVKVTLPPNVNFTGITQNGMPVNPPGVASTWSPALPLLEPDIEWRFWDAFYRHAAWGPVWQVVAHETGHNVQGWHTNEIPWGNSGPCIMNSSILGTSFSPFMRGRIWTAFSNVWPSWLGYTTHDCEQNTPLSIELYDFIPKLNRQTWAVDLHRTVVSQFNNQDFEVERSDNGLNWSSIEDCDIPGAWTTSNKFMYSCIHTTPSLWKNYYRLKSIDFDGNSWFSPIHTVILHSDISNAPLIQWSNMVWSWFVTMRLNNVQLTDEVFVYNIDGKIISKSYGSELYLSNLSKWLYIINIPSTWKTERFTVQY